MTYSVAVVGRPTVAVVGRLTNNHRFHNHKHNLIHRVVGQATNNGKAT
jgi:hypothetical protein